MGLAEMILLAMFSVFGFGALWEMFEGSAETGDSIEKEERPAKARRSTKERRKAINNRNTFRGEYTTRGRNNANTY